MLSLIALLLLSPPPLTPLNLPHPPTKLMRCAIFWRVHINQTNLPYSNHQLHHHSHLYMAAVAIVAALKLRFARAVALGNSLGDIAADPAKRVLVRRERLRGRERGGTSGFFEL
jgi:hypothetical protein